MIQVLRNTCGHHTIPSNLSSITPRVFPGIFPSPFAPVEVRTGRPSNDPHGLHNERQYADSCCVLPSSPGERLVSHVPRDAVGGCLWGHSGFPHVPSRSAPPLRPLGSQILHHSLVGKRLAFCWWANCQWPMCPKKCVVAQHIDIVRPKQMIWIN